MIRSLCNKLYDFYKKNPQILEDMIISARYRECAVKYETGSYGKRPMILENEGDILQLVKKGVLSFHISVERWKDPLRLSETLNKRQIEDLRIGWDLIIDVDSENFEVSKIIAYNILDFLELKGISKYYIKFSGNKGFHIAIPWEIFPEKIKIADQEYDLIKDFPELPKIIIAYILDNIKEKVEKKISSMDIKDIDSALKSIDFMVMSHRHLFRMPYSLNEKKELLSIPILKKDVLKFLPEKASLSYYYYENKPFLSEDLSGYPKKEAKSLLKSALLWNLKDKLKKEQILNTFLIENTNKNTKFRKKIVLYKNPALYPPCIQKILRGDIIDGRKRAVFILINFFRRIGMPWAEIEKLLYEWNSNLKDPLKERYIEYQLIWHKDKKKIEYLPPNCDRKEYYKDMNVCIPDNICEMIKNPVQYPKLKYKLFKNKNREIK